MHLLVDGSELKPSSENQIPAIKWKCVARRIVVWCQPFSASQRKHPNHLYTRPHGCCQGQAEHNFQGKEDFAHGASRFEKLKANAAFGECRIAGCGMLRNGEGVVPSPMFSLVAVISTGLTVLVASSTIGSTRVSKSRSCKDQCENYYCEFLHLNFSINRITTSRFHLKRVWNDFANLSFRLCACSDQTPHFTDQNQTSSGHG